MNRDPLSKFENGCEHWLSRDGKGPLARIVCIYCAADAWLDQTPVRYGSPDNLDMTSEHGTIMGYFNWRCRCDECVAEGQRYGRERKRMERMNG